jgi:signal transduction histidine kinase
MSQLTEQNVQLFASYAHNKDIRLNYEITGEAVTYADRNMVSTVIRNLLNNAIKFTNKGGEVHVSLKDVDHRSELSITDTGLGIAENDLKELFQLGGSKRAKGTADESGTGLGLILCKEFISMNKGTIRAESAPGKGSRFTISLPVRSPESVQ